MQASISQRYSSCTQNKWMLQILHKLTYISLGAFVFALLYSVFHDDALPVPEECYGLNLTLVNSSIFEASCDRGTVFGLFAITVIGIAFGAIVQLVKLPPLFGMLIAGVILRYLPAPFAVAIFINPHVASALRKAAFTVVLLQGGLALNLKALRQLKGPCLRLASIPCLVECLSAMVTVHLIFGYSLVDGLLVGTILGAVSPAIVVPFMVQLDEQRMGIPTLILASASLNVVIAIAAFALVFAISFSHGNLVLALIKAPLELVGGVLVGLLFALILLAMPFKYDKASGTAFRFISILVLALLSMFGSKAIGADGVGAVAVLVMAAAVAPTWSKTYGKRDMVRRSLSLLWTSLLAPIMFGLIGAQLDMSTTITPSNIGQSVAVILIGIVLRTVAAWFSVMGAGLTQYERMYVAMSWIPKATVQAALAPLFLDTVLEMANPSEEMIRVGNAILSIGILSILILAPLGAAAMSLTAPVLLTDDGLEEDDLPLKGKVVEMNEKAVMENGRESD